MKRTLRIIGLVVAHIVLVALIVLITLANWAPAIYTSAWFKRLTAP